MRQKILEGKKLEWSILVLFAVSYIIITIFHEPWFDEAQAWQLAKNVSLKDLFLETPHYEGHPPLWWLILAIPAKLGVSFELGLKTIGFIQTLSYCSSFITILVFCILPVWGNSKALWLDVIITDSLGSGVSKEERSSMAFCYSPDNSLFNKCLWYRHCRRCSNMYGMGNNKRKRNEKIFL